MDWANVMLSFLSEAAHHQVVQSGFLFTLAAFIHAGRVKKEIATQFSALTASIDKLVEVMKTHSERLDNVEKEVGTIKQTLNIQKGVIA